MNFNERVATMQEAPVRMTEEQHELFRDFHKFYYGHYWKCQENVYVCKPQTDVKWLGRPCMKFPFDLWALQEVIYDTRPEVIVECGTAEGGTALFMATVCELMRCGQVITIDVEKHKRAIHPGITWVVGDVLDPKILKELEYLSTQSRMMVILDDDHRKNHVLQEMEIYGKFVSKDCYLLVEDTNINGHPVFPEFGPGPWEAVEEFLPRHPEYIQDRSREHFGVTYHPGGWLLKIK